MLKPIPAKSQRILIIDDDHSICDILQELLVSLGYVVAVSHGVSDIDELIKKESPDLIVLDYLLPSINGGALCKHIKENRLYSKIPVIIYSAYPLTMTSLSDYGCDAFITKPFDLNEMIDKIEKLTEG
ncbi:response regulator [Pedobacter insulae]|uniref:Response regulator receiver domain-containing protein n=1 Tax=Pedobacter insulae TaxID=414048 RepID=A0A1I2V3T7_9SPHI|nr:response regulator [Pedobacter insulae]SFG81896.1 Response regulator receiver domain-containing protein [Pedobacter insulae]